MSIDPVDCLSKDKMIPAVKGTNNTAGNAVYGTSAQNDAVVGLAQAQGKAGVLGLADHGNAVAGISKNQTEIYGQGGQYAGYFQGNVVVTGTITAQDFGFSTGAADFAERFDTDCIAPANPGTVMVIGDCGRLEPSRAAYDKRVAGVVSGAGGLWPGMILNGSNSDGGAVIALVGKVYCKVDAQYGAIEVGDMLTASETPGHAMKADPARAVGAVIGKALNCWRSGRGLIPILISRL
jgi:hypothetical protein